MLRFRKRFAHSHQGLVRGNNEDAGFAGSSLLAVADGVGGAAAGEVASASAAYVVAWYAMRPDLVGDPVETLAEAVRSANAHLQRGVQRDSSRAGMATTLTAILIGEEQCALLHVGDSRGYVLRDGSLQRFTRDDTLVQDFIDAGDLGPEEVATHPYRSVVVNSLNAESACDPAIVRLDVRPGDRLLLCSDGLTDVVGDDVIAQRLVAESPQWAARSLVDAALDAGGPDNVTCVVADVEEGDPIAPVGQLVGSLMRPHMNLVDPAETFAPAS